MSYGSGVYRYFVMSMISVGHRLNHKFIVTSFAHIFGCDAKQTVRSDVDHKPDVHYSPSETNTGSPELPLRLSHCLFVSLSLSLLSSSLSSRDSLSLSLSPSLPNNSVIKINEYKPWTESALNVLLYRLKNPIKCLKSVRHWICLARSESHSDWNTAMAITRHPFALRLSQSSMHSPSEPSSQLILIWHKP